MKVLVDVNLSREWVDHLAAAGLQAIHWSSVGPSTASDPEIFAYARSRNMLILTQDLDFSQILFETASDGPSVVLLRVSDQLDPKTLQRVVQILANSMEILCSGALMVVDDDRSRVRRLPFGG